MKKRSAVWLFTSGGVCGLALALCLGAAEKKSAPSQSPKPDWSRLQVFSYPNSLTGVFDPDTGRLFMYDINVEECYAIREITTLGLPMRRLKN